MKPARPVLVVIACLAAVGCAFLVLRSFPTAPAQTPPTTPSNDEKAALARLQGDLLNATPHFIDRDKVDGKEALDPEERKIQDDLIALFVAGYAESDPSTPRDIVLTEAEDGGWLDTVGTRYLLLTEAETKGATDEVLDTQTGKITPISQYQRYYLAPERDIALYIDPQALYTYSLNQASAALVSSSQLSGTKTYHDGVIEGADILIDPQETHTTNSITIAVFDSSKSASNPEGGAMYTKIGQKTLTF